MYWNAPCAPYGYEIKWQATSPDNSEGIAMLPTVKWGGQASPGCRETRFSGLSDVLAAYAQSLFKDVTFSGYRERPDLIDRGLPTIDLGTLRSSFQMEAGFLDFTATDFLGQRIQGRITGKMVHVLTQAVGSNGVPGQTTRGGVVEPVFVYSAKVGQFKPRLPEIIRKSIFADPRWAKKMHQHHQRVDGERTRGNIQLMRFQAQFIKANSGLFSSFGQRSPNGAWLDRERTEAIRGVETYVNRSGEEVQLDNTYPYAWDLGDRTYLITSDASYNPNAGSTLNAVRMRQAP